jgi:hypothetical protein
MGFSAAALGADAPTVRIAIRLTASAKKKNIFVSLVIFICLPPLKALLLLSCQTVQKPSLCRKLFTDLRFPTALILLSVEDYHPPSTTFVHHWATLLPDCFWIVKQK